MAGSIAQQRILTQKIVLSLLLLEEGHYLNKLMYL